MPDQGFTNFERTKRHRKNILKDPLFYFIVAGVFVGKSLILPAPESGKPVPARQANLKTETIVPAPFRQTLKNFKDEISLSFGDHKQSVAIPYRNTHCKP
jgi:hypothetical protein